MTIGRYIICDIETCTTLMKSHYFEPVGRYPKGTAVIEGEWGKYEGVPVIVTCSFSKRDSITSCKIKGEREMVTLGDTVRDIVSGFEGVAVSRHIYYLNECHRITVQPKWKEGKLPEAETFDEPQLEVISQNT